MDRKMVAGILLGAVAATSIGAVAGYRALAAPDDAEVTGSTPIKQVDLQREQQCEQIPVVRRRPVKDEHRIAGTAIGAVAGNQVQKGMQERDTFTATERRCRTVERPVERVVGYDVHYTLGGKPGQVRMDHAPAERIPVRNGRLVLEPAGAVGSKG